jgi:transglutaminase-like putative cysteine protease
VTERRSIVSPLSHRTSRRLVLQQRIRYRYTRPVTDVRQRLRIVPPSAHGCQQRRAWHLAVEGVQSSSVRTFIDPFGNVTVDVHVPRVDDAVEFVLDVEADTESSAEVHDVAVDHRYVRHTRLTAAGDAMIELASGLDSHDIASICSRVHHSLGYEWGVTGVRTTASEALAGGRGVCQDFAHIMLAACRLVGLPARYVSGHLTGEGGSHAWVEVLHPHPRRQGNWIAEGWDPTHDRRANADYLVVAVGRDYADAAPLSGSYKGKGVTNTLAVNKRLHLM